MSILDFLIGNPWGGVSRGLRILERQGNCPYCNRGVEVPPYTRTKSTVTCGWCNKTFKYVRVKENYFTGYKID